MVKQLTLLLPEDLAGEAEAAGLLRSEAIERLIREEIRRCRVNDFFAAADRLAGVEIPALTEAEIESEIRAARDEKRGTHAHRT